MTSTMAFDIEKSKTTDGEMGDLVVKARRYLIYPMLRPKSKELVVIILCAAFLATIYIYGFTSSETENAVYSSDIDILAIAHQQVVLKKNKQPLNENRTVAGVLVICASRPAAIRNHLRQILELRTSHQEFPITVSQDGSNDEVKESVLSLPKEHSIRFWRHTRETTVRSKTYQYIAAHYKWALDKMFKENDYDYVIITEDDLDIAPDFFSYFAWAKKVLVADPSLLCASAWNDNGLPRLIDTKSVAKIWRTDFFPGLGWMLSRKLWEELSPQWPTSYWDDWLRGPDIRKNRSCLRPEIPRSSHNMALAGKGSSGGLYKNFLNSIKQNKEPVDFTLIPVEPLIQKNFDVEITNALKESQEIPFKQFKIFKFDPQHAYKVVFNGVREWMDIAKHVGIMSDIRGGMPRTAYRSIVPVVHHNCRVYIIPKELDINNIRSFSYNKNWDAMVRYLEFATVYCKPTKYTGKCDPHSQEMKDWFKKKGQTKKLENWGNMIVV